MYLYSIFYYTHIYLHNVCKCLLCFMMFVFTPLLALTVNVNPTLPPISFTGDTVSNISPTNINSTISLSCSVVNEGRFIWNWTLPSGVTQPPTFILDTSRTSVIEVTSNETGDYQCLVGYSGLSGDPGPSAMFTITLALEGK